MVGEQEVDALRAAIADALSFSTAALDEITETPTRFGMVMKGLAETVNDHASAMLRLAEDRYVRSSKVLLRTIMESWIMAGYVAADDSEQRAKSYIMKETAETKRLPQALLRLTSENPEEQQTILASTGLPSLEDLKERITQCQDDTEEATRCAVPVLPNIADCAKAAGVDLTYRTVYGYLLSAQVHARAGDTLRASLTGAGHGGDLSKVLQTTLFLLVQMLRLASEHLGHPEREGLVRFESLLQELKGSG